MVACSQQQFCEPVKAEPEKDLPTADNAEPTKYRVFSSKLAPYQFSDRVSNGFQKSGSYKLPRSFERVITRNL